MKEISPMGPGFFIFFQQEEAVWIEPEQKRLSKLREQEDEEIIMQVIKCFLDKQCL